MQNQSSKATHGTSDKKPNVTEHEKKSVVSEHEKKNEGGREFGHIHEPSQAQLASDNAGEADNVGREQQRQQQPPQHRQPEEPHPLRKKSA